jgi:hypothetical protein
MYLDEIIGDHQRGFQDNRLTASRSFAFVRYWRKNGSTFVDFKKACDSVMREVLHNILT